MVVPTELSWGDSRVFVARAVDHDDGTYPSVVMSYHRTKQRWLPTLDRGNLLGKPLVFAFETCRSMLVHIFFRIFG